MTAPAAIPAHTGDRFAARTSGGPARVGHFLLITWAEAAGRRGRPSLCGKAARTWRRADTFDVHVPACQDCSALAGIETAPPRPFVSAPRTGDSRPLQLAASSTTTAHALDPQVAGAGLPDGWTPRRRFSVPFGDGAFRPVDPRAADYVPRAQLQREHEHAAFVGQLAFPAWAPLTFCATP